MMFLSSVQKLAALRAPASAVLRRQNSSFVSSRTALTVSNGRRRKQTSSLRSISQTPLLKAQITVNVPTMGDSITEGTIVEWCVPPGSNFREGDVLALVETDKVTVDIKAERDGVLIKQLGEVDDNVESGRDYTFWTRMFKMSTVLFWRQTCLRLMNQLMQRRLEKLRFRSQFPNQLRGFHLFTFWARMGGRLD
ncbi:hypothetical protein QTG54_004409 [Skeletonema marinoi]|uniref:Lipoamide acyltransferase component of branched-chain alpha-keto acid dehydrogenase complex, mitochondrial n=1 Tax=Skeletonema marinoi TaxID=267567 RepID=A0AAD8YEZ6_9STRA|nr:hypothetical protein QTG54_004409 [Skeletonema marinoi]